MSREPNARGVTVADIAERSEIGVPARVPRSVVPDSLVHPAAGPTARVRAGIARAYLDHVAGSAPVRSAERVCDL
jgi:hypothetical protein